jgi:predicted nucleotidyltransferase component of viral defense system
MIYKETTTEKMQNIAQAIFDNLEKEYYLAGGTALALQIGHRKSIDLDYFINGNIDILKLKNRISEIFKGHEIEFTFEEKNTLWCIIDMVKVSFISRFDALMDGVLTVDNFRLASINDLTAMKLSAICGREEYKDYFDLACLATITDVRSWNTWWQKVYKNSDPISFIIALANINNIQDIPLDIENKFIGISPKEILPKAVLEIKNFIF